MLLAFALEAVLAILAAIGVWRERGWAAMAVLWLGVSIALTALIETDGHRLAYVDRALGNGA